LAHVPRLLADPAWIARPAEIAAQGPGKAGSGQQTLP